MLLPQTLRCPEQWSTKGGMGRRQETFVLWMASNIWFWFSAQRHLTEFGCLQGAGYSQCLPSISDTPHSNHPRDLLADTTQGRPTQVNKNQIPPPWLYHSHLLVFQLGYHRWWVCRITADSISGALFQAGTPVPEMAGLSFPFSFLSAAKSRPHLSAYFPSFQPKGNIFREAQKPGTWVESAPRPNTLLLPLSGLPLKRLYAPALKSLWL